MSKIPVAQAMVLFAAAIWQGAYAADSGFTSEASFVAAAGSTVIESFETTPGRSRGFSPVITPLLTATPGIAPVGVQTAPDSPETGFGAFAPDGTRYLSVYLPGAAQGTLRLDFATPTQVAGFNIIDVGETSGTVSLRTDTGFFSPGATFLSFPPTVGNGTVFFVGLTQTIAFSQLFIEVTGVDEAYGIDKVYLTPVPEPATAASLLLGIALLARLRARRH